MPARNLALERIIEKQKIITFEVPIKDAKCLFWRQKEFDAFKKRLNKKNAAYVHITDHGLSENSTEVRVVGVSVSPALFSDVYGEKPYCHIRQASSRDFIKKAFKPKLRGVEFAYKTVGMHYRTFTQTPDKITFKSRSKYDY